MPKFNLSEAFELTQQFIYLNKTLSGAEDRALTVELAFIEARFYVEPETVAGVFESSEPTKRRGIWQVIEN